MPSSNLYNATPPRQPLHQLPDKIPNPDPDPSIRVSVPRQSPVPGPTAISDPYASMRVLPPPSATNLAVLNGQYLPPPPPNQYYPPQPPNQRRRGRFRDIVVDILEGIRDDDNSRGNDGNRGTGTARRQGRFHRPPFIWHYSWRSNRNRGSGILGELADEILDVLGEGKRGGNRNRNSGREALGVGTRSSSASTSRATRTWVQINRGSEARSVGTGQGGGEGNNGESGNGGSGLRRPYGTYTDGVYSRPSRPMIQR